MEKTKRFHHEEHSHAHTHENGECHTHAHTHEGEHVHEHGCASCDGCDPMAQTLALMQYMVRHNAAHARELEDLGKKLGELGNAAAMEQVLAAVSEFEKGNLRLSAVLASLKG